MNKKKYKSFRNNICTGNFTIIMFNFIINNIEKY